jgi:hypothetical protein
LYQRLEAGYGDYVRWKARFERDTRIDFSVDVSFLEQWGFPSGGSPSLQIYAAPTLDWTAFESKEWGTGSVLIAYSYVPHYPTRQNAADITAKLGLITPINDFPDRSVTFSQLTYTQTTPDNRWSFAVGQYSLFNFDGNEYLDNQQGNFNNFILTQNGSATYLSAGWGGYAQYNATRTVQFAAGVQATNNPTGETLTTRGAGQNCCAWFVYAQWTPSFRGMGSAQYSLSYFDTPSVPTQASSRNWSLNAAQNLDDTWAIFARANTARGAVYPIRSSYALGVAMNDPLKRVATNQLAVAVGYSDVAPPPINPAGARNEKLVEAYWSWTFFGGLLLTPSVQVTFDPALSPGRTSVIVLSARATVMF